MTNTYFTKHTSQHNKTTPYPTDVPRPIGRRGRSYIDWLHEWDHLLRSRKVRLGRNEKIGTVMGRKSSKKKVSGRRDAYWFVFQRWKVPDSHFHAVTNALGIWIYRPDRPDHPTTPKSTITGTLSTICFQIQWMCDFVVKVHATEQNSRHNLNRHSFTVRLKIVTCVSFWEIQRQSHLDASWIHIWARTINERTSQGRLTRKIFPKVKSRTWVKTRADLTPSPNFIWIVATLCIKNRPRWVWNDWWRVEIWGIQATRGPGRWWPFKTGSWAHFRVRNMTSY